MAKASQAELSRRNFAIALSKKDLKMCLSEMKENQKGLIQKINGDSRFVSRVVSMGLPPSSPFLVLQNDGRSPVLLYSHDTMIAINRKECAQIDVEFA